RRFQENRGSRIEANSLRGHGSNSSERDAQGRTGIADEIHGDAQRRSGRIREVQRGVPAASEHQMRRREQGGSGPGPVTVRNRSKRFAAETESHHRYSALSDGEGRPAALTRGGGHSRQIPQRR